MSVNTKTLASRANGKSVKTKAFVILGILAMGTVPGFADTYGYVPSGPRAFRGEMMAPANPYCTPANGAEVLGGFAGDGQWVDRRTGFACGRW